MLKYHIVIPHKSKLNIGTFYHYLNLGSHQSPYSLQHIHAFSIVTLNPKEKLPTIANNEEQKFVTAAIPLHGNLKVDSANYEGLLESKILWSPKDICVAEGDEHAASFAYIAIAKQQEKQDWIEIKKLEAGATLNIEKSLVFVVQGKASYREGDIEVSFNNKGKYEELPYALYTSKSLQLQVDENSTILLIRDSL